MNAFESRKEQKRIGDEREAAWRAMSPQEQLKALDDRLGKDVGAKKQRARIAKRAANSDKLPAKETPKEVDNGPS